ncbi:hypothetical protein [Priestia aryabhattai]
MGTHLSFQLTDEKWMEIRRCTHNIVEIKIRPDSVLKPLESYCSISEKEFIKIIMDGLGERLKRNEKKE